MKFIKNITLIIIIHCNLTYSQTIFDKNGKTPLIAAVQKNNIKEVKIILEKDINVNEKEKKELQGTALMYASSLGNLKMCKILIEKGANINDVDINNDHALNWATFSGKKKIMAFLIDMGADLSITSKHGNAIDVAFRLWHHDSIANVFREKGFGKKINLKERQLIEAVKNKNLSKIKKLIKRGVSPNTKDELGIPILQLVAQNGDYSTLECLVNIGADVNILNRVGQTPLTWAARFNHLDIVYYLLKKGANPNLASTTYNLTSLIGAAVGGNTLIGELLLKNGAHINSKDVINDAAALHWAIFYKKNDFAKMLIENKADFKMKILNNSTDAYEIVKKNNITDLKSAMEKNIKDNNKLLGSWKIKEIHYIYTDTVYKVQNSDYGRIIFTNKNYSVMYNPYMDKRKAFKNLSKPEEKEIIYAFNTITFNTGSYKIKDSIIYAKADIAKVPGFENGEQFFKLGYKEGKVKSLIMFDETYPNGKKPEWFGKLKIKLLLKKEL